MKFTKRQLQIIAHSLSILRYEEAYKGEVESEMQDILAHLQKGNIWGHID